MKARTHDLESGFSEIKLFQFFKKSIPFLAKFILDYIRLFNFALSMFKHLLRIRKYLIL